MRSKKIILDTNLWISYLITGNYDKLDELIEDGKVKLVFSKELIEEFITVVKRPKLAKYFNDSNIEDLLRLFDS